MNNGLFCFSNSNICPKQFLLKHVFWLIFFTGMGAGADQVSAFVRIRPPTQEEGADAELLPELAADGADASLLGGFSGVLGPAERNGEVFARCLAPRLPAVLRGGAVSVLSLVEWFDIEPFSDFSAK